MSLCVCAFVYQSEALTAVRGGRRYVKFDTFHPAVDKGLPVTRVVSRVTLQAILAEACKRVAGAGVIQNNVHIVDYEEKVRALGRVRAAS